MTLVVPCYNEAQRWDSAYWSDLTSIEGVDWLFVDDGSSDSTGDLLEGLRRQVSSPRVEIMHLGYNQGKAEAVRRGLWEAIHTLGARHVGFVDADGAFAVSEIRRMHEVAAARLKDDSFDAVWSARVALSGHAIERSLARHYLGRLVATFVSVGRQWPYDTQSGLKLFITNEKLTRCLSRPFATRWLFEIELLQRWQALSALPMRIWEEPLHSWKEIPGSKITGREVVRISSELLIIKRQQIGLAWSKA